MQVCVQDPRNQAVYLLKETELAKFAADADAQDQPVGVLLVERFQVLDMLRYDV